MTLIICLQSGWNILSTSQRLYNRCNTDFITNKQIRYEKCLCWRIFVRLLWLKPQNRQSYHWNFCSKKPTIIQWYSIRIVIVTDHYCNVTICKYISFSIMWHCVQFEWILVLVLVFRWVFHVTWFWDLDRCPKLMLSSYVNYMKMSRI